MGKALTLIGMMMFINIVGILFAFGSGAIDPNSKLLAYNGLLGHDDMISQKAQNTTGTWVFSNNMSLYSPTGTTTGGSVGSGTSIVYPDWIQSSVSWITTVFKVLLNIVGMPYTMLMYMIGGSVAAVIGIALSIINMFILVNWMFGKVD